MPVTDPIKMDKVTSLNIAGWLACAAFVLMMTNQAFSVFHSLRGKEPHPPNNELGLTQREIDRRVQVAEHGLQQMREEMNRERELFEASARARSAAIYNKIDEMRKEVSQTNMALKDQVVKFFGDVE